MAGGRSTGGFKQTLDEKNCGKCSRSKIGNRCGVSKILNQSKNVEYEMVQEVCRYQPDRARSGKGLKTGEVSGAQATDDGMRQTKGMV
jgi:hypothetical protein